MTFRSINASFSILALSLTFCGGSSGSENAGDTSTNADSGTNAEGSSGLDGEPTGSSGNDGDDSQGEDSTLDTSDTKGDSDSSGASSTSMGDPDGTSSGDSSSDNSNSGSDDSPDASDSASSSDASDSDDSDGEDSSSSGVNPPRFDVLQDLDTIEPESKYDFSLIWIANSPEGTVSKVDTLTATELARYRSGPDNEGTRTPDPSRTSVNLQGVVGVANRFGGEAAIVAIAPELEQCVDRNGDDEIQTSTGPDDILAWGEDECVLWQHDLEYEFTKSSHEGGPRAVAWDAHQEVDEDGKVVPDPRLWVAWRKQPDSKILVRRLEGKTGVLDEEVEIDVDVGPWRHAAYGGAVDGDGAFWISGSSAHLTRVDPDLSHETFYSDQGRPYGIAMDKNGDPWFGGFFGDIVHYDRATGTFEKFNIEPEVDHSRGIVIDRDGHAWVAAHNGSGEDPQGRLVRFDTATKTIVDGDIRYPDAVSPVGVSVDAEGMIWVVDWGSEKAVQVNPDDYDDTNVVEGFVRPYTYSDMTGAGLSLVTPAG